MTNTREFFSFISILLFSCFILLQTYSSAQVIEQDSLALVALYDSTSGDSWTNNSNWKSGPVSTWYGVILSNNRVLKIWLPNNRLSGRLPEVIGNLTELIALNLQRNQIVDTIPSSLGNLSNLVELYLDRNQISGSIPEELGRLSSIQYFYLNDNQLSGSIPDSLGNLNSLSAFTLSNNQLSGSIPSSLGNINTLAGFSLSNNQLTGSIPASLGNVLIQSLDLSNNQLTGSIPNEIGNISALLSIHLEHNQLSGTIPESIYSLPNLSKLYLNNNQIADTLSPDIGNMISLAELYLNNNWLFGSIPASIGNLYIQKLNLSYNNISGTLPATIYNLNKLIQLDLSFNQIADTISQDISNMTSLDDLYLNNNLLFGNIPSEVGNTSIENLWLNNNQLEGNISAKLKNNGNFNELYLQNNKFSDMDDWTIGFANYYIFIEVEDNFLTFEDIEPNIDFIRLNYSPQAQIGETLDTTLYSGDSIIDTLSVGGTANVYHWFKDSVEISGANDSIFILNQVQIFDAGEYYCTVTNTIATNLTLYSRSFTLAVIDTTAPAIPQNLSATPSDSIITLNWNANNELDSIYYRIYMDTLASPTTVIDSTNSGTDTTIVIDRLSENGDYYFRITAVDLSGNESGFSNEVLVTPSVIDTTAPAIPQNLSVTPSDSTITLNWNANNELDSIYYRIYMDTLASPTTVIDSTNSSTDTTIVIDRLSENDTYYFRITAVDLSGNESGFSNEVHVTPVGIENKDEFLVLPKKYKLEQNYPNPFNPSTTVKYGIPEQSNIKIEIFNMLGQSVGVLVNAEKSAGFYETTWNATNLPSGVYLISIRAEGLSSQKNFTQVKKALLLK